MLINSNSVNRGDTLIEVLFAVAVFSLVAVGALSIMNQGTATSQRALEITLVRQEINAQAETLRFINSSYIADSTSATEWVKIQDKATGASVLPFNTTSCVIPPNSFILNTHKAEFVDITPVPAKTFSQVRYKIPDDPDTFDAAEGIWVEAIRKQVLGNNQDDAGYIDFHIRACWDSPGQSASVTLGTIVRLYEPI